MGTQGTLFFIIILIAAVWQIITVIVNAVAKKQQDEKMAEMARQRRQAGGDGDGDDRPKVATAPSRSRLDEIAARRQAQLEELRMRRESQGRPVQVRTGGTATAPQPIRRPPSTPIPQQRQHQTRDMSTPGAARPSRGDIAGDRQAAQRAAREAMQRRLNQQARLQQEQRDAQAKQRAELDAAAAGRRAQVARRKAESADRISPYRQRGRQTNLLTQLLREPGALRQAIVLKEIIDRPLALRDREQLPGHVPAG